MNEALIPEDVPSNLPRLTVCNKIDLLNKKSAINDNLGDPVIWLSAKTGDGLPLLRQKLLQMVGWEANQAGEGIFMARQRHLEALSQAKNNLINATSLAESAFQLDLLAEELRMAQHALAEITGEFTADDLLGEIFSNFCIGK